MADSKYATMAMEQLSEQILALEQTLREVLAHNQKYAHENRARPPLPLPPQGVNPLIVAIFTRSDGGSLSHNYAIALADELYQLIVERRRLVESLSLNQVVKSTRTPQ